MTTSVEKPSNSPCYDLMSPILCGIMGGGFVNFLDRGIIELGKTLNPPIQGFKQPSIEKTLIISKSKFSFLSLPLKKMAIFTVIPIFEEIIFRKFLRDNQLNNNSNKNESSLDKLKRITFNSSLFALAHIQWKASLKSNILLGTAIFNSGIVYNLLMDHQGILSPIVAHCIGNGLGLYSLKRIQRH